MSCTITAKLAAFAATVALGATVAASTPADASANARWSDGSFSEVFFQCRSYGIGASNFVVTHNAWGSGSFSFRFWIRNYPSGQWSQPSAFHGTGSLSIPQPVGNRWQLYVELWHLPAGGSWQRIAEYGYVIQNSIHQGYGAPCAT